MQEHKCNPANIAATTRYSKSIGYHLYHVPALTITSSNPYTTRRGKQRKRAQHDTFHGGVLTLVKHR